MKVVTATYVRTGQDSSYNEIGTVTVTFSNNRSEEFEKVDHLDFKKWAESNFDHRQVPHDMTEAFRSLWNQFIDIEIRNLEDDLAGEGLYLDENGELVSELNEDDEDDDDEADVEIRDDDYLGQVTGFPTPGFKPDETRSQTNLGQVTGFPIPGYDKRKPKK